MKHKNLKLLLVMLMGMVGLDAAAYDIAVENENGVTIYYNFINEGTELSVTQGNGVVEDFYSNDYSGSVVIPASVSYNDREYDVTAIDDRAFQYCLGLKSITTGSNIKSIGEYAFFGCYDLTTATILDGVTTIGDGAFECCSSLTTVTIPNSITSIGGYAFSDIGVSSPLYNSTIFFYIPPSFDGAYTIPDGITTIAGGAFDGCSGLTSITIPDCLANVGAGAFTALYLETSKQL